MLLLDANAPFALRQHPLDWADFWLHHCLASLTQTGFSSTRTNPNAESGQAAVVMARHNCQKAGELADECRGEEGIRTLNIRYATPALYQLSYNPKVQ